MRTLVFSMLAMAVLVAGCSQATADRHPPELLEVFAAYEPTRCDLSLGDSDAMRSIEDESHIQCWEVLDADLREVVNDIDLAILEFDRLHVVGHGCEGVGKGVTAGILIFCNLTLQGFVTGQVYIASISWDTPSGRERVIDAGEIGRRGFSTPQDFEVPQGLRAIIYLTWVHGYPTN